MGLWLAKSGQRDEAKRLLDELRQESTHRYVQNYSFAVIHIGLNEKEQALALLEKEIASRSPNANYYGVNPELEDLRSDSRFKEMLKRLNLPE